MNNLVTRVGYTFSQGRGAVRAFAIFAGELTEELRERLLNACKGREHYFFPEDVGLPHATGSATPLIGRHRMDPEETWVRRGLPHELETETIESFVDRLERGDPGGRRPLAVTAKAA